MNSGVLRYYKGLRPALKLSGKGRYFYVNTLGVKHAVNIRKDDKDVFVIFDDNKEINKSFLTGKFYHRD